jgi:hypothetical protein
MKKIFYSLIFFFLYNVYYAYSQIKVNIDTSKIFQQNLFSSNKVTFGLLAGYSISDLYGSDIDYIFSDSKTYKFQSFHVGMLVNSQVGKYFWFKHVLLLNQKGTHAYLSDSTNGKYGTTLKMLYIDLYPIAPTFYLNGLQIFSGPYISALLNASIQRKDNQGNMFVDESIFGNPGNNESNDKNKYLQKVDFGFSLGIEYQFSFGLLIGIKYNLGLMDIFQYANSYTFNDSKLDKIKIYNRGFMISLGLNVKK